MNDSNHNDGPGGPGGPVQDGPLKDGPQIPQDESLSFTKLTAMIIGSTIGGGIFTTAGDMAASGAHTGSVLIGWAICGIGMFGLMMCFFGLNRVRPDLTNGVYSYAREGFGEFVGFNSAWGYWVSALLCNVSYTTLLFGALGYFFPVFGNGSNLTSVICASILIWLINWLVLRGVKEAAFLNIITTISKMIPILVFIVAVIFVRAFDPDIFMDNFWGNDTASANQTLRLPLADQVKATTSATVWSFIGVEGAVVLSGRARRTSDVGKASLTGFLGILAIYVMVAVLSMGVMTTRELAALPNPQMASILQVAIGPWGAWLVNIGVILSLAGALLGWTILAADCPYSAAQQGVFMKAFARSNDAGSPSFSLFLTNGLVQLFLIVSLFSDSTYQVFYYMSATMIMVPYLLSALYYLKVVITSTRTGTPQNLSAWVFAIVGSIYGFWMLYSTGSDQLLISSILYAPGILIFALGKQERHEPTFRFRYESFIAAALVVLAMLSLYLIFNGTLKPF